MSAFQCKPYRVFDCPCPAVLGNHDYHDTVAGEKMQLAYAQAGGTRWKMLAKWYRMELRDVADANGKQIHAPAKGVDNVWSVA